MNACLPSRSAKLTLMVLTVVLTTVGHAGPGAAAEVPGLTLPAVALSAFAPLPPQKTLEVTPALKDAGALKIYLDKLKGKCLEDNVIIDRGNEYLRKH